MSYETAAETFRRKMAEARESRLAVQRQVLSLVGKSDGATSVEEVRRHQQARADERAGEHRLREEAKMHAKLYADEIRAAKVREEEARKSEDVRAKLAALEERREQIRRTMEREEAERKRMAEERHRAGRAAWLARLERLTKM